MTRAEIQALFPPGTPINFGGKIYAQPSMDWVTGPFWQFYKARLWSDNLSTWAVPWECRDFTRAYACYAQECNALTPDAPGGADALAIGG